MKATYTFDQIAHFRTLAEQKGVSPERLQEHYALGVISDVLEIPDPKMITPEQRDAARCAYGLPPLTPPALEPVGTVTVQATTEPFIARDHLVKDTSQKAAVKIAWISSSFEGWFLGETKGPAPEARIRYAQLTRSELDGPILKELGNTAETTLAAIHGLMKLQPNGESGALLTNGYVNIFYVRDINGVLRAVCVGWYALGGGWGVYAFSVAGPGGWVGGGRVFSRNS